MSEKNERLERALDRLVANYDTKAADDIRDLFTELKRERNVAIAGLKEPSLFPALMEASNELERLREELAKCRHQLTVARSAADEAIAERDALKTKAQELARDMSFYSTAEDCDAFADEMLRKHGIEGDD